VALIFVRDMSDPLTGLVKRIDARINEASPKHTKSKLGTFVIVGDAPGRADQLRSLAQWEGLNRVNLCIGAAPQRYEVNGAADVTVVIYTPGRPRDNQVVANFAFRSGELTEAQSDAILEALSRVLPK
jgi:hypothetical protein